MKCRLFQWSISRSLERGKDLGARTARHVADCTGCGAYLATLHSVEERLRADAQVAREAAPAGLHTGIMRAVRTAVPEQEYAGAGRHMLWRLASVAALALIATYSGFRVAHWGGPAQASLDSAAIREVQDQLYSVTLDTPARVSEPMEQEMVYLEEDVRETTQFLLAQLSR